MGNTGCDIVVDAVHRAKTVLWSVRGGKSLRAEIHCRQTGGRRQPSPEDRKSVVEGKSVSVRVDLGGRRIITKKQNHNNIHHKLNNKQKRSTNKYIHTLE